jgi:hypothetical protein
VKRRQQLVRLAHRMSKQRIEAPVGHREAGAVVEEILVHAERAVQAQINDMIENRLNIFRLAIGREPHDLVLAGVHLEPKVIGEGGIR